MLDPKFIYENLDAVALAAKNKGFDFSKERYCELFELRLKSIKAVEELRSRRNSGSDQVKKAKSKEERDQLVAQMRELGPQLEFEEKNLREVEEQFNSILLATPSIPSQDTRCGHCGIVQGVTKLRLARFIARADFQSACLEIIKTRTAVRFSIGIARGHPGLNVIFLDLPLTQITRAHLNHTVGKFQQLKQIFCIFQQLCMQLVAGFHIGFTDHNLLDFLKLVNTVQALGVFSCSTGFPAETAGPGAHLDGQLAWFTQLILIKTGKGNF